MPLRLAGLWSGPSGMHSRMMSLTSASTLTGAVIFSPPWREHAVPDRLDFGQALQDADLRIDELGADRAEAVGVVLHAFGGFFELEPVRTLDDEVRSRGADALHEAGCDDGVAAAFHLEEGEFEGGAAGTDFVYFPKESRGRRRKKQTRMFCKYFQPDCKLFQRASVSAGRFCVRRVVFRGKPCYIKSKNGAEGRTVNE